MNLFPVCGGTVQLIYTGKVYNLNKSNAMLGRLKGSMRQTALRQFGRLPPACAAKWPAYVTITRVLGPGQRLLDEDKNLQTISGPCVDAAVQGGWLYDDRPAWARFTFHQDATRRAQGPRIELTIRYVATFDDTGADDGLNPL